MDKRCISIRLMKLLHLNSPATSAHLLSHQSPSEEHVIVISYFKLMKCILLLNVSGIYCITKCRKVLG